MVVGTPGTAPRRHTNNGVNKLYDETFFLAGFFLIFNNSLTFSQDTISSGMGSKSFDHCYSAIKSDCNSDEGYVGIKLKKKKIKKDLWITSIISDAINGKISFIGVDSILRTRNIKPFITNYEMPGFNANKMIINSDYITFALISATEKEPTKNYIGATLKSSYRLYCKSNLQRYIEVIHFDVDFFRKKVMKKITCPYEVYEILALGDASFMWNELRFHF